MNVVCYVNTLSFGGAERVMSVLASGLAAKGHKVTLVTDYLTEKEYALNVHVHRVVLDGSLQSKRNGSTLIRTFERMRSLRTICKNEQTDVLISFMRPANIRAILSVCLSKTKSIFSVRIDPQIGYQSRDAKLVAKWLYPLADGCVFQTEEAKACFSPKIQKKSQIIFNPIADGFYQIVPAPLAEKKIVTCGRLEKQKRFDLLIDAFNKVCDEFPDYRLDIYGVGGLQEELQTQIEALGRQEKIQLMGRCEDIPNTIKTASLFVLSSDYEGLPNALMEAMVVGLPVISTDCGGGGARALIEDGVDGLIVPCGDADALAEAIRKSLADPEKAKQRGEKAREKAKGFSTENIITQWENYIQQVVDGKTNESEV